MNEFELISRYIKPVEKAPVVLGRGDDGSLVDLGGGEYLVQTSDVLVQDVHFRTSQISMQALGRKALAVNISDMAAMAATPQWAHLTLGLPPDFSEADAESFFSGFYSLAEKHNISLVGGDLSRSSQLFVDVHLSGRVKKKNCKLRAGLSRPGSLLCVSGPLGLAAAGFYCLENEISSYPKLIEAHQCPPDEVKLASYLGSKELVYGMMDLSDGLLSDLHRIPGLSAVVDVETFPLDKDLLNLSKEVKVDPLQWVLAGGEDYRLLFNCAPDIFQELKAEAQNNHGNDIFSIGQVTEHGSTIQFFRHGQEFAVNFKAFSHF